MKNLRHHYETHYKNVFIKFEGRIREDKLTSVKKTFAAQHFNVKRLPTYRPSDNALTFFA